MEITFKTAARVFWSYFWRAMLVAFGTAFLLSLVARTVPGMTQPFSYLTLLINVVATFIILGFIFNKDYKRFRVSMVDNASGQPLPQDHKRTTPLWFAFFWRHILLVVIAMIPVALTGQMLMRQPAASSPEHQACLLILQEVQTNMHNPAMLGDVRALADKFQAQGCEKIMEDTSTRQQAQAAKLFGLAYLVGMIIYLLGAIKIFQMLLKKRFRQYHIAVSV